MPRGEHNDQPDDLVTLVLSSSVVELVPFIRDILPKPILILQLHAKSLDFWV